MTKLHLEIQAQIDYENRRKTDPDFRKLSDLALELLDEIKEEEASKKEIKPMNKNKPKFLIQSKANPNFWYLAPDCGVTENKAKAHRFDSLEEAERVLELDNHSHYYEVVEE